MIASPAEVLTHLGLDQPTTTTAETLRQQRRVALLNLLHPLAERLIKRHLGHDVEFAAHVEYLPGRATGPVATGDALVEGALELPGWGGSGIGPRLLENRPGLQLTHLPVRTITTVYENPEAWRNGPAGYWPVDTLLTAGADYALDADEDGISRTGLLLRLWGSWPATPRSVRVEYQAGWTAAELADEAADIKLAVLIAVGRSFNEAWAHQPSDDFLGSGAVSSEGFSGLSVGYTRAAENLGLMTSLPPEVLKILEPHVRMSPF